MTETRKTNLRQPLFVVVADDEAGIVHLV